MTPVQENIETLIKTGESDYLEFKISFGREAMEALCAFANCFKVPLFPIGEDDGGVNELLKFIKQNPGKNTKEIKEELGLPQRTVERRLKILKEQEKIEFRGAPKTGGYYYKV